MNIVSLLSERRVIPEMSAGTRDEVLDEMVSHLVAAGDLSESSHGAVVEALAAREERVSTGIGHGVAIPHCYSDSLNDPVALFGRSRSGIDFNACDNAVVHFVILLVVPETNQVFVPVDLLWIWIRNTKSYLGRNRVSRRGLSSIGICFKPN